MNNKLLILFIASMAVVSLSQSANALPLNPICWFTTCCTNDAVCANGDGSQFCYDASHLATCGFNNIWDNCVHAPSLQNTQFCAAGCKYNAYGKPQCLQTSECSTNTNRCPALNDVTCVPNTGGNICNPSTAAGCLVWCISSNNNCLQWDTSPLSQIGGSSALRQPCQFGCYGTACATGQDVNNTISNPNGCYGETDPPRCSSNLQTSMRCHQVSGKWVYNSYDSGYFTSCDSRGCNTATQRCFSEETTTTPVTCIEGQTQCGASEADRNSFKTCANNKWSSFTKCTYTCANGQCINNPFTACPSNCSYEGYKQCSPSAKSVQVCNFNPINGCLDFTAAYSCGNGACFNGECKYLYGDIGSNTVFPPNETISVQGLPLLSYKWISWWNSFTIMNNEIFTIKDYGGNNPMLFRESMDFVSVNNISSKEANWIRWQNMIPHLTSDGNMIYMLYYNGSRAVIGKWDRNGKEQKITNFFNPHGDSGYVDPCQYEGTNNIDGCAIAMNDNYFFILVPSEGIMVYNRNTTLSTLQNKICFKGNTTGCGDIGSNWDDIDNNNYYPINDVNHHYGLTWDYENNRLLVLFSDMVSRTYKIDAYSINGQWLGTTYKGDISSMIPYQISKPRNGNYLYIYGNQISNFTYLTYNLWSLSRINDNSVSHDECTNGSSQCIGDMIDVCHITDRGWWWSSTIMAWSGNNLLDDSCIKSGGHCINTWANHITMVASCQTTGNLCQDDVGCNESAAGNTKCDPSGTSVMHCSFRNKNSQDYVGNPSITDQWCWQWDNYYNWTTCAPNGACFNGKCANVTDSCEPATSKCITLGTDSGTSDGAITGIDALAGVSTCVLFTSGKYSWQPFWAATPCYWGCTENVTANHRFAQCNDADNIYTAMRSSVDDARGAFRTLAGDDENGRTIITGIIIAFISLLSGFYIGWQLAIINGVMIAISFALIGEFGVMSIPIISVFIIIAVYLMFKMWSD